MIMSASYIYVRSPRVAESFVVDDVYDRRDDPRPVLRYGFQKWLQPSCKKNIEYYMTYLEQHFLYFRCII